MLTHTDVTTTWALAAVFHDGCDVPCYRRAVVRGGLGRCGAPRAIGADCRERFRPPGGALRMTSYAGCYRRPGRRP